MKSILTLFISLFFSAMIFAQPCMPDSIYADSAFGIYPPPYDSITMTGGIDKPACINEEYEFLLNFVVPESIFFPPTQVNMEYIDITDVTNLPDGINYGCNPEDCRFEPSDGLTCLILYGTASSSNSVGDYELGVQGKIKLQGLPELDLQEVLSIISPGGATYSLELRAEGECVTNTREAFSNSDLQVTAVPNPFAYFTQIQLASEVDGLFNLRVMDILGRTVYAQKIQIFQGENTFELDGSNLSEGMYTMILDNGRDAVSKKLLVSRK